MDDAARLLLPLDAGLLALPAGEVLFLNARPSPALGTLAPRLRAEQGHRGLHDALAAGGIAVAPEVPGCFPAALLLIDRDRARSLGLLARALEMTRPGAPVLVSGLRTDGIGTLLARARACLPVGGVLPKAHGKVFWFRRPEVLPPEAGAWAAAAALRPNAEGMLAAPGMFSHGRADPGSRLLAGVARGLAGRVAELGAGWGWLAHRLLADNPGIAELALLEADHAALAAARANVTDPRARFRWADATRPETLGGPFDVVVTNPPHHAGGRASDPALGQAFLAAAARILAPDGRLLAVANRQLPYEAALGRLFAETRPLGEAGPYKLLEARRPLRAAAPRSRLRLRARR